MVFSSRRTNRKSGQKKHKKKKSKNRKTYKWAFFSGVLKWGILLTVWAAVITSFSVLWIARDIPAIIAETDFSPAPSISILDRNGNLVRRYGSLRGQSVTVNDVPDHLIHAVLAIEDRRFYEHSGIDLQGLARALIANIRAGEFVQGGSTITQQLAKNMFLTQERKITRKIKEMILALWLEKTMEKDEILSAYLNRVYMGSGVYGVEAAAKEYFNKNVSELTVSESAVLAGLLKAPSVFSPNASPFRAQKRARVVLNAMRDIGYVDDRTVNDAQTPLPVPDKKPGAFESSAYFADWIINRVHAMVGVQEGDLFITTTLDRNIQTQAARSLTQNLKQKNQDIQGAVIVTDHEGAIRAMVGGRNYNASQFNRATQAKRQPGSAFKPLLYLTALEKGWEPSDTLLDALIEDRKYSPRNFDGYYHGDVTVETALAQSLNTAAVRLMDYVSPSAVIEKSRKMGIRSRLRNDLSLALGTSEISLLELTAAYSIIAREGRYVNPYGVVRIENKNGDILFETTRSASGYQVADREASRKLQSMMRQVIKDGTGKSIDVPFDAAGKTGTSQNSRDAWFVGFTPAHTIGIWLGKDNNTPMQNVTGSTLPAYIWEDIAHGIYEGGDERMTGYFEQDSSKRKGGFGSLLKKLFSEGKNPSGSSGDLNLNN